VRPTSFGTRRNAERGSPGDEPGRVRRQGKALEGRTPGAAAARNKAAGVSKDETLEDLRKVEEGRRSGGTGQYADLLILERCRGENLKGGALGSDDKCSQEQVARARGRLRMGSLKRVRSLWEKRPLSLESGSRRKPEDLEGDRKERRGGTGEPNSRYGLRRDAPRGRKTS